MRWCTNNYICRFLFRHIQAVLLALILLLCANQVIHFSRGKPSPVCYKIISPFSNHNNNHGVVNLGLGNASNDTESNKHPLVPDIPWSRARLDDRRMIKIYDWVWPAELWSKLTNNFNVCLATQGSIDRIASIGEVSEKWLGPISLAVYVRNEEEFGILTVFVAYMKRCNVLFSQTVSIHLVVPINFEAPNFLNETSFWESFSDNDHPCGQPHEFMITLMKKMVFLDADSLYPQNHMRNIARKNCGTPWVFMTDVDIIPRPNSSYALNEFYNSVRSKCHKCAYVVPVFELDKSLPYPSSKKDLIAHVKRGLARQFHLKIYRYGHWASNYSAWMSSNLQEDPIKISHNVDNKMNHYEPFYVSTDDIPKHDERFIGYGFTRSSQVLEARIMGWKFFVLTPIFAIHWGLQTPQSIRSPSLPISLHSITSNKDRVLQQQSKNARRSQNLRNHIIYTDFVSELVARYNISMLRKKAQRKQMNQG